MRVYIVASLLYAACVLFLDWLIMLAVNFLGHPWHVHVGFWWVVVAVLLFSVLARMFSGSSGEA